MVILQTVRETIVRALEANRREHDRLTAAIAAMDGKVATPGTPATPKKAPTRRQRHAPRGAFKARSMAATDTADVWTALRLSRTLGISRHRAGVELCALAQQGHLIRTAVGEYMRPTFAQPVHVTAPSPAYVNGSAGEPRIVDAGPF